MKNHDLHHKKILAVLLILALTLSLLTGCGKASPWKSSHSLKIVTTIFPEYDWVLNLLGENPGNAEVKLLLDNGQDPHSYQPGVQDILTISTCDIFIYVGGESDEWIEDALGEAINDDIKVIDLLDILGSFAREEELIPGMQGEDDEEDEGEETEFDEHVWLSLSNAELFTDSLCDALCEADPDNEAYYRENEHAYAEKLHALDDEYRAVVSESAKKTLLFADRFPFRYMTDDYGLSYYAAFPGCSSETEASFETITFLSQKLDELDLNAVLTIDGSDGKIAETVVRSSESGDQKILMLDSMQSSTSEDIAEGKDYLYIMEKNLSVLKEALQ